MASALTTAFGDFVTATGPAVLHAEAINEAQLQNYLLRRFLRGKGPEEILQGGQYINEQIMFDENTTGQFYHPNQTFTWENPQVLDTIRVDWRFLMDHMAWTDQEIELNAGGLGRGGMFHQFKRLKRVKEMRMWTSLINIIEKQLFAVPRTADMESASGKQPFSIPAFINEQTDGLFFNDATPTGETAWTTVEGLNPTTITGNKWEPQRRFYTSTAVNNSANIVSRFDDMFLDTQFIPPPTHEEYFTNPRLNSQFIACSKRGQTIYVQQLRAHQDTFVTPSRQDPAYMNPKASGIDLVYVPYLDTAALYAPTGSGTSAYEDEFPALAGASGDSDYNSGPRYYWINGWFMKPVFHTSRYFYKHPVRVHPNQPTTHIAPVECWYNFICYSRQRQGIVAPDLDLYV